MQNPHPVLEGGIFHQFLWLESQPGPSWALCGIVLTQYFPNLKYWIMLLTVASEAKSVRSEHST
jgi:hypothetical protein